ncbi:MAG: hypothetical protein ACOZCO_15065 [Bacteroidota bacterium]
MNELVRLRRGNRIVGYRRREGNFRFFSADLYSWNGNDIPYENEDYFTGTRDRNNRMLFSNDIINYREGENTITCEVVRDEKLGTFFLFDRENEDLIRLESLRNGREIIEQLEWVSFVFG